MGEGERGGRRAIDLGSAPAASKAATPPALSTRMACMSGVRPSASPASIPAPPRVAASCKQICTGRGPDGNPRIRKNGLVGSTCNAWCVAWCPCTLAEARNWSRGDGTRGRRESVGVAGVDPRPAGGPWAECGVPRRRGGGWVVFPPCIVNRGQAGGRTPARGRPAGCPWAVLGCRPTPGARDLVAQFLPN